jgi:peptidoglycan/LPS O-acetylase OafA/YrhL
VINNSNRPSILPLTGIRAIAAYMVFIHHYNPFSEARFGHTLHSFFGQFHIGVTIFFVLSGFLICYNYYEKEVVFKDYLIKRFARIYPVYFLITSLTFVYFHFYFSKGIAIDVRDYLYNITFLRGFFDDLKFTGIAQGWSLTVEEVFYLSAPVFFLLLRKNRVWLIALPVLFMLLGWILSNYVFSNVPLGFMNDNFFVLNFTFFGRAIEFFCGIGLAIFILNGKQISSTKFVTYFGIVSIIMCLYLLTIFNIEKKDAEGIMAITINNLLLPLFGIVPLFWGLTKEETIFSKILSSNLMLLLGKSSYVFYLIHMGIFVVILNKVSTNGWFQFIVLNIIAVVIFKLIEHPLHLNIKKKFIRS